MPSTEQLNHYGLQAGDSARSRDTECSICQDTVKDVVITTCQHVYCFECITRWLTQSPRCPECRHNLRPSHLVAPTGGQNTAPQIHPSSAAAAAAPRTPRVRINAERMLSAMWRTGTRLESRDPLSPRLRPCAKRIWAEWETYLCAQDGQPATRRDLVRVLSHILETTVVVYGWCEDWRQLPADFVMTMRRVAEAGAHACVEAG